jgi:hypothetical protein
LLFREKEISMTTVSPIAAEEERTMSHSRVAYETYRILQFVFVVAPIVAGADKFFGLLASWDKYLAPPLAQMYKGHSHELMMVVGIIEIIAGIGVAVKPRYFGYVVAAWLCAIVINLLSMRMYYDIALRDFGLAVAAIAMARVAKFFDHGPAGGLMAWKG